MLLLFTSTPINCFTKSEDVSAAIFLIFSGELFLRSKISFSALFISSAILISRALFFLSISLTIFSLALLK